MSEPMRERVLDALEHWLEGEPIDSLQSVLGELVEEEGFREEVRSFLKDNSLIKMLFWQGHKEGWCEAEEDVDRFCELHRIPERERWLWKAHLNLPPRSTSPGGGQVGG